MKWKDRTRRDIVVESEIKYGEFKLSVHHYIGCGDTWFASCGYLFNRVKLASTDLNEAKIQAKSKLQVILSEALNMMLDEFENAQKRYKKLRQNKVIDK